jgi:hypothetical protein
MKRSIEEDDEEEDEDENKKERKKPRKRKQYDSLVSVFKRFGSTSGPETAQQEKKHQTHENPRTNASDSDLSLRNTETLDGGGTYSEFIMTNAKSVFVNELEDSSSPLFIQKEYQPRSISTPNMMHSTATQNSNTPFTQTQQPIRTIVLDTQRLTSSQLILTSSMQPPATTIVPHSPNNTPSSASSTDSVTSTSSEEEQQRIEQRRKRVAIKNLLN